jgi:hypothetical protein
VPPYAPVALDVRSERPDPCTVRANPLFVGSDHISRGAMPAVQVQTIAIAAQLKFFLAETLFVSPQVRA